MANKVSPVRSWIVIIFLLSAIILSFTFQRGRSIKYEGTNFIQNITIPNAISNWKGKDVGAGLNVKDDRYAFIGEVFAREYINEKGNSLLLLILNAKNFHYPNVCFISSGFEVRDLDTVEFNTHSGHTFYANALYTQKTENSKFLIVYWIIIDKKHVPNWVEQKIKQLYFSMFNKKNIGLMVRLDIPITGDNIEGSLLLAKEFVRDLSQSVPSSQIDYIIGQK